MSKEIAQTVGGKKLGLLLTLLAALAVIATLGSQWLGANAAIGVSASAGAGTASPVLAGSTGNFYDISFTTSAATSGDLALVVDMNGLGTATAVTTTNGSLACTISTNSYSTANQVDGDKITGVGDVSCIWTGSVPSGAIGSIRITYTAGSTLGAQTPVAALCDNGDLSNAATGCVPTTNAAVTIVSTASGLAKTPSTQAVDLAGATGVAQTITWTNNGGQNVSALTITDAVPAGVTVTAITTNTGTSSLAFPANCGATLPLAGPATITCTSNAGGPATAGQTAVIALTETVGSTAVARTLTDTANATATFALGGAVAATAATANITQGAGPITNVELKHVNEAGNIVAQQDVFNNVRGARHTACLFSEPGSITIGTETYAPYALGTPLNLTNIQVNPGGGFQSVGDEDPTFSDPQFFTGTAGQATGASCFSWTSSAAGDQELSVVVTINGSTSSFNWDTDADGDGAAVQSNRSLVKEWNVLQSSSVTASTGTLSATGAGTATVNYTYSRALSLNPSSGLHNFTSVTFKDDFLGSHITRTGANVGTLTGIIPAPTMISLVGVPWKVSFTGCGLLNGQTSAQTQATPISGTTTLNTDGSVGGQPSVTLTAGSDSSTDCSVGSSTVITFTGQEPGVLGSGPGNTVTEKVTITYTQVVPIKQVLLAWAGQRVLLDHDWRMPPGDSVDFSTDGKSSFLGIDRLAGSCPFTTGTVITYVKGAEGPGNFVAGLNATLNGADQASVTLTGVDGQSADNSMTNDFSTRPQNACISRVIYESEDQGEVDVEAFPASAVNGGVGKVAFVIYYMKLNQVQLSLVTQVAKPTHNMSGPTFYADYAPGNPWDASKDATGGTADWNVSKDILVRGRVTGWFTNSNPSGRARDDSNKQNVLPADRWVMPDDWANIAGGAALASTFRPSYDLMFAPNNAAGFALALPHTTTASSVGNQIAAVASTSTGRGNGFGSPVTALPIVVTTKAFMATGQTIIVGSTPAIICAISPTSNSITVYPAAMVTPTCNAYPGTASGLVTAPAAGTPIFAALTGVPFIGPYSLVDVPGFAGLPGPVGAAENNNGPFVPAMPNQIFRDTTQGDGVVDWWDAPMPPAETSVAIRGTGFIKQVLKEAVYYNGTPVTDAVANGGTQYFPNPYYYQNIPSSPWLPAVASGGGFIWDSWGADGPNVTNCVLGAAVCTGGNGPYHFWQPAIVGTNSYGVGDSSLSTVNKTELAAIQVAYGNDTSIARDLVVYSDNHGEFMVTANGDFKTDLSACATNVLAGGKQCKPGDKVGVGTITAVADYPDFVKHFPVASNAVTVNWTWGGYKDVTIEKGETDQYSYVVFHAMDRDGHCSNPDGAVLLHPVLTELDLNALGKGTATNGVYSHYPTPNQLETVDFLIDSGNGIILSSNPTPYNITGSPTLSGEHGNVIGVATYSVARETAYSTGMKTFPLSPLAASGQTDECQAWIKVSNSLLGVTNVLAIAHDDEGNIGFDKVIDFQSTMSYTLNFRWSLITWNGADNIPVADALKGGASTKNPAGNDISASVTAVYGWDQAAQQWLAFFPTGVNVPGANNLTALKDGSAYWIAITGPGSVTWTVSTNVS